VTANYKNMPNQIGEVTANSRLYTNVLAGAVAVTPSNTTNLTRFSKALYIGSAGNLTVEMEDGTQVLYANVPAGTTLNIKVAKVMASGTAAGNIVAIY
jgi:hypothetical protein